MSAPDLTSVTAVVDFVTVTAAILAVFASLAVFYVAGKAAGIILDAIGRKEESRQTGKRWEALMGQSDGIWFSNNETGEVKFRPHR